MTEGLVAYGIPMTFASAASTTTVGTYWMALSPPGAVRTGPVGLAPYVGLIPPASVLAVATVLGITGTLSASTPIEVAVLAMIAVAVLGSALASLSGRPLLPERLLSPARSGARTVNATPMPHERGNAVGGIGLASRAPRSARGTSERRSSGGSPSPSTNRRSTSPWARTAPARPRSFAR